MPESLKSLSPDTLQAVIAGLEAKQHELQGYIHQLRAMVGSGGRAGRNQATTIVTEVAEAPTKPTTPRKRNLSVAARKRIAAAQKKRWAVFKKAQKKNGE